jgi:predicted transcriptional regulator
MTSTTGIKLDDDIKKRLQALGKARDRSPHWLMKHAIVEYIEREERNEQERCEDEERYQEYLDGKFIPHEKMLAWMNKEIKALSKDCGE